MCVSSGSYTLCVCQTSATHYVCVPSFSYTLCVSVYTPSLMPFRSACSSNTRYHAILSITIAVLQTTLIKLSAMRRRKVSNFIIIYHSRKNWLPKHQSLLMELHIFYISGDTFFKATPSPDTALLLSSTSLVAKLRKNSKH